MSPRLAARVAWLLRDAAAHVPFYREFWGESRLAEIATLGVGAFAGLPLVGKADLLAADPARLLHSRSRPADLAWEHTSGSSGRPFAMPIDRASLRRRRLRFLRALLECGYRPGRRLMLVSSQATGLIERRARWTQRLGWYYCDVGSREEKLRSDYLAIRPHVLYGPMSALLHLADDLRGRDTGHWRPKTVISTGEQLMPQHRRQLVTAFGPSVTDFYGMTEFGLVSWRRVSDRAYRKPEGPFFMEFLPSATEHGLESLVVTGLGGGALPLVRFDTGDLVRRDHALPDAPVVEFVGRSMDALQLPGGRRVSPYRVVVVLEEIPGLEEYRVTQQVDGSVDVALRCRPADASRVSSLARSAMSGLCDGRAVRLDCGSGPLPAVEGKRRPIRSKVRTPQ